MEAVLHAPAVVKAAALVAGISLERDVSIDEVAEHLSTEDDLVWVDVTDPGPEELELLLEMFGFHPLAIEDVASGKQRPKLDEYKGYSFLVTYAVKTSGTELEPPELAEIDLFVGKNYLVTVHRGPVHALDEALKRWTRGEKMMKEGVGYLVYTVLDAIIDSYFPVVDQLGDVLDDAESEMYTTFQDEAVQALMRAKRTLMMLRRVLYPQRETFNHFVRRMQPTFSPGTFVYFQDVHDHVLRIVDSVDMHRDTVTSILDAYAMTLSNRLNSVMKTLTVVSVAAAIANLVFGAWGMNVRDIPFTLSAPAFWGAISFTVLLVSGTLFLGSKRGWI